LGTVKFPQPSDAGIPERALRLIREAELEAADRPSSEVLELASQREQARLEQDWAEADRLRERLAALGWQAQDTKTGQRLTKA
jgi:cysteinyl-tRNA synthetase